MRTARKHQPLGEMQNDHRQAPQKISAREPVGPPRLEGADTSCQQHKKKYPETGTNSHRHPGVIISDTHENETRKVVLVCCKGA